MFIYHLCICVRVLYMAFEHTNPRNPSLLALKETKPWGI